MSMCKIESKIIIVLDATGILEVSFSADQNKNRNQDYDLRSD